jgi:hypothetical protein
MHGNNRLHVMHEYAYGRRNQQRIGRVDGVSVAAQIPNR